MWVPVVLMLLCTFFFNSFRASDCKTEVICQQRIKAEEVII